MIPLIGLGKPDTKNGLDLGVYAGAQASTNLITPRANNFKYNMYNGGELGGFVALKRSKWIFTANLGLQLLTFNYKYQHPQISAVVLQNQQMLLMINSMFAFGLRIIEQQKYCLELAGTWNFTMNTTPKNWDNQYGYLSYYDATLQATNQKIVAIKTQPDSYKVPYNASIGLSIAYHRWHLQPWYLRCNLMLFSVDGASVEDWMTLIAIDPTTSKPIQKIEVFHNRVAASLTFGITLNNKKMH